MHKHLTSSTQDRRRQDSSCSFPYMAAPDVSKSMGTIWRLQVSSGYKHMQITAIPREAQAATSSLSNLLKANNAMLGCWEVTELPTHYLWIKQQLSNSSHSWLLADFFRRLKQDIPKHNSSVRCWRVQETPAKKKEEKRNPIKEKPQVLGMSKCCLR